MATIRSALPHEQRTAGEPRENRIEPVVLADIREINPAIRILRLNAVDPQHTIKFLPGQWLDTFIPGLDKAGGFTITSTPSQAAPSSYSPPFLELAVQKSTNPPAQWLWRPAEQILGAQLAARVGGSFTWPPAGGLDPRQIERLVLVAGGVGINPLVSIFSHLIQGSSRPREVHFVYSTKANSDLDPQQILFLPRLMGLVAMAADSSITLNLFLTGMDGQNIIEHGRLPNRTFGRRIAEQDLIGALNGYRSTVLGAGHDRKATVCYVCGPPRMTDQIVAFLRKQPGMSDERVLCEKWW